ncbi:MAG: YafY family protein [Candidatus Zixiibacteriota bacterium]
MSVRKNRYARLLGILNMIQSREAARAEDIASAFGISIRTVYRDIETLSDSGIPVFYQDGFKLSRHDMLPPVSLSRRERTLLRMAIESSPLNSIDSQSTELARLWEKIVGQAEDKNSSDFIENGELRIVPSNSIGQMLSSDLFKDLEIAVHNNTICRISYINSRGGVSKRNIHPYSIVFRGRAFYLLAHCQLHDQFRLFRMERIKLLELTADKFIPDESFDIDRYFEYSWAVYGGEPYDIKIRFSKNVAEMIRTGRRHHTEKITNLKNGGVDYIIRASGLEEISRWLVGFGADAKVIYPKILSDMICNLAQGACGNYKKKKKRIN